MGLMSILFYKLKAGPITMGTSSFINWGSATRMEWPIVEWCKKEIKKDIFCGLIPGHDGDCLAVDEHG